MAENTAVETFIVAIHTYGKERVKDARSKQWVSAYKIGYTSAASHALLFALDVERARAVTMSRANYNYFEITGEFVSKGGYLVFQLTSAQVAKAEEATRRHLRAEVYLWRDGAWWEFPTKDVPDYAPTAGRTAPTFDPLPLFMVEDKPPASSGVITLERSEREEGGAVWWWLGGDTYPHRELLKEHGARWSAKRKQWYVVGAELPTAIRSLVTSEAQKEATAPLSESVSPLLAIFGGCIVGKERTSKGDTILKGENGVFATRTTWIDRNDQPEFVWVFDLPPHDRVGISLSNIHDVLKSARATFSLYTRKWHFDQPHKVAALDALADDVPFSDDDPCTVEEAAKILGLPVKPIRAIEVPSHLFTLDQTVYARHDLEAADRTPIPTGTVGKVVRLYQHNAAHGWSYDVDFAGVGVCWCFEHELTDYEPVRGIRITHGALVPPGIALPPTDAEIKRTLIKDGQQPEPFDPPALNPVEPSNTPDEVQAPPAIRVIKPTPMPPDGEACDVVQTAIREVKTQPLLTPSARVSNGHIARIGQAYVGELTGSITGQVFCYGYAVHDGVCVYVNMAGPRMGIEAIRAKLSKGEQVSVMPPDAPTVELTAGEGNSGMYHAYLHYLPEARFASLILVHDWAVSPKYGGKFTTFIFRTDDAQATAKLKHHVTQLVNIPVFETWSAYLYEAGQRAMLVRKTRSAGGVDLLSVDLDVDAWTRLITGGLEAGVIHLPMLTS